jgi:hypothetical protein
MHPWEECVQVIFFDQLVAFGLASPFFFGLRIVIFLGGVEESLFF